MTREEFGLWLMGVLGDGTLPRADRAALVLRKAGEILSLPPAVAVPPAMLPFTLRQFCAHNVADQEHCDECALAGASDGLALRVLIMPKAVRQIFVRREHDVGTDRDGGRAGGVSGVDAVAGAGGA